jgi:glyoxylase I family protein
MPAFSKISHISFSARDAEKSALWWSKVFDLQEIDRVSRDTWHAIMLIHVPTATIIEFQQHNDNPGDAFDPRRSGIDHMAFKVDSPAELDQWREHFERLGVTHSPISDSGYGSVLSFKDPDGIQFEMFYLENHP